MNPMLIPIQSPPPHSPSEAVSLALIEGINAGLADRVSRFKNLWETLWENPRATPEEILESLGVRAGVVFAAAQAGLQDFDRMAQIAGTTAAKLLGNEKYLSPAQPVTVQADGHVTISK